MESVPLGSYLKLRPETLEAVRRSINLDKPGEMKDAVRILDEWIHQQLHFRHKDFPPEYLENTIVASKGSLERAKASLDKLFTIRGLTPDQFALIDVKKEILGLNGMGYQLVLPQLTEDHTRVLFVKFNCFAPKVLNLFYKTSFALVEYLRLHDYHRAVDMIVDMTGADVAEALTANFNDFKTNYQICMECFQLRLNRVDCVTSSSVVNALLAIVKPFIKKKTADRISVVKTPEDLHQYYPKSILPQEYGGGEKSLKDLQVDYLDQLSTEEHRAMMRTMSSATTDEALRSQYKFNDLYAGTVGTFRALTLD
ncbi:alpha-tocopherol transfer protein-like isoform X2 [Aricia agestis]|nr:alpha-tocopherol transfer protein-like isoform X2 [Aricia agestis]XP_041983477.1 alpha-tocopherol transfer protein-like isoform X2 [Aricia agestis]